MSGYSTRYRKHGLTTRHSAVDPSSSSTKGSHSLSRSPPNHTLEYSSSAPVPPSSSKHQNGYPDEPIPSHLYERLPAHLLKQGRKGKAPDYLRMILMCESQVSTWGFALMM